MKTQYLNPKELFEPRFFTHTVAVSGAAKIVYVSGQVSYDRKGAVVAKGDMHAQSEQVFACLTRNLKAAGASWGDVIKMNGYMVGMTPETVTAYREVRTRFLDPKRMPASTLVGVDRLVHEDLLLEVEVIAALAARPRPAKKKKKR
jgi:enamine deaminase RidA (YjgF/YER057c/UK114 family)